MASPKDGMSFYDWWGKHRVLYRILDMMTRPLRKQAISRFDEDNQLVLDIGCGPGRSTELIDNHVDGMTLGLDYSEKMVSEARKKNQGRVIRSDATELPFEDNSVDGVFASLALTAMSDVDAVLDEVNRVLRKDGRLVAVDATVPRSTTIRRIYRRVANWQGHDVETKLDNKFAETKIVRRFDGGLGVIIEARP